MATNIYASGKSLRELTRLPGPVKGPEERWKILPTRPRTDTAPSQCKTPKMGAARRTKSAHTPGVTPGGGGCGIKTPKSTARTPKDAQKTVTTSSSSAASCRFIPRRHHDEYSSFMLMNHDSQRIPKPDNTSDEEDDIVDDENRKPPPSEAYTHMLLTAACGGSVPRGVLSFNNTPTPRAGPGTSYVHSGGIGSAVALSSSLARHCNIQEEKRKVDTSTERILDAPELVNDYYLNLLDWSSRNIVAIALGEKIYLWNGGTGQVEQLQGIGYESVIVTALSWAEKGRYLAVGLNNGSIQLYDADKCKKIRTMSGHSDRVSCLHWSSHLLASGSRSGEIHLHDVRLPDHLVGRLNYHRMEVCGLRWSPDGSHLASGANDNSVCIWKPSESHTPVHILTEHQAAVKALAWCPWKPHLLATGGGTKDKMIRFWDTRTGECSQLIDTKSQVSSIHWSQEHSELISSHGYPKHQLIIWKFPSMTKLAELRGHTDRVLHTAISPDTSRVISASADETLRVWHCFKKTKKTRVASDDSMSLQLLNSIR